MSSGPEGRTSPCRSGGFPNRSSQSHRKVKLSQRGSGCFFYHLNYHSLLSGKKGVKLKEKTKVNRKKKKPLGDVGPVQLEMNGELATEGQVGPEEVSGEDEQEVVSSGNVSVPSGNGSKRLVNQVVGRFEL